MPQKEVSEPTTECMHCGVRFLCDSKDYGTSNMLGHIPKCPKFAYAYAFDLKDRRKGIAMFVISDSLTLQS